MAKFQELLTFDDVLLVPNYSDATSRKNISLKSKLTKNITLNVPLVSSNMDTVTEDQMAIAMARRGGIGILHRFCSIQEQVEMVKKVKRAQNIIITNPYTIDLNQSIYEALDVMNTKNVNTLIVVSESEGSVYKGLLHKVHLETHIKSLETSGHFDSSKHIFTLHTYPILVVSNESCMESQFTESNAIEIMTRNGTTKLPLVDENSCVTGLVTMKDIHNKTKYPLMSLDQNGRLLVGAAIGVKDDYLERAKALINAGTDVIVIDIAHGHSVMAINATKQFKLEFPDTELIVGNICTKKGFIDLVMAGADGVKLGIGPSAICSTRLVTGFGMPQLSAILYCKDMSEKTGVPIIADGGIKTSGDIVKAIVAGASTVMMGSKLSGTDQAPGKIIDKNGQKGKVIRGMAGSFANLSKEERIHGSTDTESPFEIVTEGIESFSPYKGDVHSVLTKLIGGIQSGVSYGGGTMELLKSNTAIVKVTNAGRSESGVKYII